MQFLWSCSVRVSFCCIPCLCSCGVLHVAMSDASLLCFCVRHVFGVGDGLAPRYQP
ncbi:hypothetical protein U1Q18_003875, partial [Sarracenia purpurea var. burkii]